MTDILDHTYAVIMAGGGGTRLWPVSRKDRPKQMIPLVEEDRTLFQTTIDRLRGLLPMERILVVTVADQRQGLQDQAPEIPDENFLIEPLPRGTASVVGLAAVALQRRDPQAVMAVLPADHFIRNRDLFHLLLRIAVDVAEKGYLVTLGINPTYAATGYGYIQRGELIPERVLYPVYLVSKFKEKPSEEQARSMLSRGDHSWNSGIFVWRVEAILEEIQKQMAGLHDALAGIRAAWDTPRRDEVVESSWPGLKNETVDYGIMEHAQKVAVLPAGGLEWSDVGSWDSLFDVLLPDHDGNVVFGGQHTGEDTHNSLIYGNRGDRMVVTIGVDDLIIVDGGDVLLVCRKDQAQKVRKVVDRLKDENLEQYL